jgi:hypothetical protein
MAWAAAVAKGGRPTCAVQLCRTGKRSSICQVLQTVMEKRISSPIKRQSDKPEQIDSELHQNRSVLVFVEPRQQRKKMSFEFVWPTYLQLRATRSLSIPQAVSILANFKAF